MSLRLQNKLIGVSLEGKKFKKTFPSELLILTSYAVDFELQVASHGDLRGLDSNTTKNVYLFWKIIQNNTYLHI